MNNQEHINDLCTAILLLKNKNEVINFLKDLCTPQELKAISERWHVCRLLHQGNLSYREIHKITKASLATIGRVARFLKNEPYQGYQLILTRIKK